jgi:archaellum biogenesis ATPase FlaH
MNYEYCTALNHRNRVVKETEVEITPTKEERYISMFGYDNSIYEQLSITKSVQNFKGNFFCKYVYLDIDSVNLEESHTMAKEVVLRLYTMLGINPKSLFISFSGNKGFHIGLHQNIFGGFEPSKDLPDRVKVLVVRILMELFEVTMTDIENELKATKKKEYRHMDLSIYTPNRIFRVVNSCNQKSGLYKIGLTYDELTTLTLDEIKAMAVNPRTDYKPELPISQIQVMPYLKTLWEYALQFDIGAYAKDATQKGKAEFSIEGNSFNTPEKGNRNNDLFRQACMLFDKSDLSEEQVMQLVGLINATSSTPLPRHELDLLVRSAFKKTLPNKATKARQDEKVENFMDWFDEWADYYTAEARPLTCIFPEFDRDQEQNYIGKLMCLIGKGGTRKSYFAKNVVARNILDHNARVMYSSMEMGKVEMVNRLLDLMFPIEDNMPASKFYRMSVKKDKEGLKKSIRQAAKILQDNLILSNVAFKTVADYQKDLQKARELYGQIDILCVDGLSMMGGKGSEMERFEKHTAELKELAKQENIFVILICHTTKEAKQHTRDCAEYVRGSGKILDNCDFTISFSNLIDEYNSTPENIEYVREHAHLKYYNKRGTGAMWSKVYDFCGLSKSVTPSMREPFEFPDYDKFVKEHHKKGNKSSDNLF